MTHLAVPFVATSVATFVVTLAATFVVLVVAGLGLALGLLLRGRPLARGCDGAGACGREVDGGAAGGCGAAGRCPLEEDRP